MEGLISYEEIISEQEESDIIAFLDTKPYDDTLMRLTQHYGYKYNYRNPMLTEAEDIPNELVLVLKNLMRRIRPTNVGGFDQCIVNNYTKGQMISKHIDNVKLFGNIILSLSLGSPTTMIFKRKNYEDHIIELKPRMLLIMKDECRYDWSHELIPLEGNRRISITFRKSID